MLHVCGNKNAINPAIAWLHYLRLYIVFLDKNIKL